MKKIIFFILSAICLTSNAQNNYKSDDLKGFDSKTAWEKALKRSNKAFEQKEFYQSLERNFIQSKKNKNGSQVINSTIPYNYAYDKSKNKTTIGLNTASTAYCVNSDFSNVDFSNWQGYTYCDSLGVNWDSLTPTWLPGIVSWGVNTTAQPYSGFAHPTVRQTILTLPPTINNPPNNFSGWDSIAISYPNHLSAIPFVPPSAGGVTCRLGNANPNYETEELSYVLNVSPQNSQFTYAYAVVLYDGGHAQGQQPFFKVSITDGNGNPIPGCGQYQVDATMLATDTTFKRASTYNTSTSQWTDGYTSPGVNDPSWFYDIYYKPWSNVGIDLTPYIGQTVVITFQTADCIYGGHWGYAYIDGSCSASQMQVNMCSSVSTQQIIAPAGYATYQWYGPNSPTLAIAPPQGTKDTLTILNGTGGDVYYLTATALNGCVINVSASLQNSQIGIAYTNSSPSCSGGSSGMVQVNATGSPANNYIYTWVNSLNQIVGTTQQVNGLAPGTYSVHVTSSGASCGSADATATVGVTAPVASTLVKSFCGSSAYLTLAAGSSNIQWYDPSNLPIASPQGVNDTLLATNIVNGQGYTASYSNSGCRDSLTILLFQQTSAGNLTSSNIQNVCSGGVNGQATINFTTTVAPPYNYTITSSNSYTNVQNNSSNTALVLTGLTYGTYSVLCSEASCMYNTTFKIDTIKMPNVTVSPSVVCNNTPALLNFSGGQSFGTCQTLTTACVSPQQITCGPADTITPSYTQYPSPYGNYYTKMRAQYIYTANELHTAGITAGNISSVAFNVTNLNNSITSYPDFNISIGCSSQSTFAPLSNATSLIAGLTNVYTNSNAAINLGINTYNFNQVYSWDGSSNLIVDVCFEVPGTYSYTTNAQVSCTSTSNYSSLTIVSDTDPTCNISTATSANYPSYPMQMRPVANFGWCSASNLNAYSYNLIPNSSIIPVGSAISVPTTSLQPSSTTHYTLTSISNVGNCAKTDTFTIFVNPSNAIIPVITQNGTILTSTQASAYQWYLNGTSIPNALFQQDTVLQNGSYQVCVTYTTGCGGCSNTIVVNNITGISSLNNTTENVLIFPNPASDYLNIISSQEIASIKIVSTLGQEIYFDKNLQKETKINTADFAKAVYFIEIKTTNNTSKIIKFIKN